MVKVLIADDERSILDLLSIYVRNEGFECLLANDGQEALDIIEEHPDLDVALLDIMMPKHSGIEVLESMRQRGLQIPVMLVTAKDAQSDKIYGLMSGADDYITKPFESLEVVLRVKALLRRSKGNNQLDTDTPVDADTIVLDAISINRKAHTVVINKTNEEIKLTSAEFDILTLLATHLDQVFSAEDILDQLWKDNQSSSARTVMVHISNLRNKIDAATDGNKVIQTVWGVGYKIVS